MNFWSSKGIKISRCLNLLGESKEKTTNDLKKILKDYPDDIQKISTIVSKYNTKGDIHNTLRKEFGSEKTKNIYALLKPVLKNK